MLILIAVSLTLAVPLLMLLLHLSRWKYAFQWLIAVVGTLAIWILLLLARQDLPYFLTGINWTPERLFSSTPILLADQVSWTFATALATLSVGVLLTAVVRIERAVKPESAVTDEIFKGESSRINAANWRIWAGSILVIGMGLVAVFSGNLLTILLAWAAIDAAELIVLLAHIVESKGRESIAIAFATRTAGIFMLILAEIQVWRTGLEPSILDIDPSIAIYLLLASGLRLGAIPLHLPFIQEIPLRRSLGTILRLVSAAASLSLLVRAASVGIENPASIYILFLVTLTGLFGAGMWLFTSNELTGRPYWILATAALTIASATYAQPLASLAWGIASIYCGGLIFTASLRNRWLRILLLVGFLCLSGLPFTPTWNGVWVYTVSISESGRALWATIIFNFCFLLTHSLILAGFLKHIFRQSQITGEITRDPAVERWIWLIYPIGILILPISHILTGIWLLSDWQSSPIERIGSGIGASILGITIWYLVQRSKPVMGTNRALKADTLWDQVFSLSWLYHPLWLVYRVFIRLSNLTRVILEGDGGILWSIVLFFMLLMLLKN